jgi:hypothetical protein
MASTSRFRRDPYEQVVDVDTGTRPGPLAHGTLDVWVLKYGVGTHNAQVVQSSRNLRLSIASTLVARSLTGILPTMRVRLHVHCACGNCQGRLRILWSNKGCHFGPWEIVAFSISAKVPAKDSSPAPYSPQA